MQVLRLDSVEQASRFRLSKFALLLACAVLCFAGLAIMGGGGALWLTDTRTAYLKFRSGAGFLLAADHLVHDDGLHLLSVARRPTGLRPGLGDCPASPCWRI
jgi:hypothetical protein